MNDDISLRHLKTLSLLLEIGSLTRVAQILEVSQPTISKALVRLRAHFGDPLLVRVGSTMRPTSKAMDLAEPLRALLTASGALRASTQAFSPAVTSREFTVLVTEVGMVQFIPKLLRRLEEAGPSLSLRALLLDARPFEPRLEAGEADLAVGFLPEAAGSLRRQSLYADGYLSVMRKGHPRLHQAGGEGFWRERHVMIASADSGHGANRRFNQILSERLNADQVQIRVPSFIVAAFVTAHTDAVATLPANLAIALAPDLGLEVFPPPVQIQPIQIDQFWHERAQNDDGHRWLRTTIFELLGRTASAGNAESPAHRGRKG